MIIYSLLRFNCIGSPDYAVVSWMFTKCAKCVFGCWFFFFRWALVMYTQTHTNTITSVVKTNLRSAKCMLGDFCAAYAMYGCDVIEKIAFFFLSPRSLSEENKIQLVRCERFFPSCRMCHIVWWALVYFPVGSYQTKKRLATSCALSIIIFLLLEKYQNLSSKSGKCCTIHIHP